MASKGVLGRNASGKWIQKQPPVFSAENCCSFLKGSLSKIKKMWIFLLDNMSGHMFLCFVGPRIVKPLITYISLIWLVQLEKLFHYLFKVIIKIKWPAEKCRIFSGKKTSQRKLDTLSLSLYICIYTLYILESKSVSSASFKPYLGKLV